MVGQLATLFEHIDQHLGIVGQVAVDAPVDHEPALSGSLECNVGRTDFTAGPQGRFRRNSRQRVTSESMLPLHIIQNILRSAASDQNGCLKAAGLFFSMKK